MYRSAGRADLYTIHRQQNADGLTFLREIGRRLSVLSGDPRETSFLFQRVSVINQRCNAAAIAGCFVDEPSEST